MTSHQKLLKEKHHHKHMRSKGVLVITMLLGALLVLSACTTIFSQKQKACTEFWVCSEWSSCTNNLQSRSCTDTNNCGTAAGKPEEYQQCGRPQPSPTLQRPPAQPPGNSQQLHAQDVKVTLGQEEIIFDWDKDACEQILSRLLSKKLKVYAHEMIDAIRTAQAIFNNK